MLSRIIRKSLPVSLDQILKFDIYRLALEHILSLEPEDAEFLKSREGILQWLRQYEIFMSFREAMKEIARYKNTLIDDSTVKFIHWKSYVANNEDVITYIYDLIKGLDEEPMVEDHTTITAITTSSNQQEEEEEEIPMETDIDELCAQIDALTL